MKPKEKADLLPEEIKKYRRIEKSFIERCRQFGYQEIKTSSIEPLYVFTAYNALSSDVLKRVYSFLDWGGWSGERVVLRPDLTISAARFYRDNLMESSEHVKLCYLENYFLLDDTGEKLSERWQFGAENIGNNLPSSDAEAIFIALDTLKSLGLETYLHLSYPSIIHECIEHDFKNGKEKQEIVKLIKTGRLEDIKSVNPSNSDNLLKLLYFKGNKTDYLENLKSDFCDSEKIQPHLDSFINICVLLDSLDCKYEINFSLSKSFEYYTGIQFEITSDPDKAKGKKLCSGGRYDNLISSVIRSSKTIPSVGFALYVRNIIEDLPAPQDFLQNIGIVVENITHKNIKTSQSLCAKFDQLGFNSQISFAQISKSRVKEFGLIIEVNHEMYKDGYNIKNSQQIDKPLLKNIVGEFTASE